MSQKRNKEIVLGPDEKVYIVNMDLYQATYPMNASPENSNAFTDAYNGVYVQIIDSATAFDSKLVKV